MLAWWEHMRPSDATLHIVVVSDGDHVIGLVPLAWRRVAARRLEERGATFRFAAEGTLAHDVEELLRLHGARREQVGNWGGIESGTAEMLVEAGRDLVDSGRFRLITLGMDGKAIAAHLLLAAGSRVTGWSSGFDDAHRAYSPSLQCLVYALKDADRRGQRVLSLGPGAQSYKSRVAIRGGGRVVARPFLRGQ